VYETFYLIKVAAPGFRGTVVRKRLGMVLIAALVIALVSLTL
jgi:hypothetical protein